jgi:hypothetical protein
LVACSEDCGDALHANIAAVYARRLAACLVGHLELAHTKDITHRRRVGACVSIGRFMFADSARITHNPETMSPLRKVSFVKRPSPNSAVMFLPHAEPIQFIVGHRFILNANWHP